MANDFKSAVVYVERCERMASHYFEKKCGHEWARLFRVRRFVDISKSIQDIVLKFGMCIPLICAQVCVECDVLECNTFGVSLI